LKSVTQYIQQHIDLIMENVPLRDHTREGELLIPGVLQQEAIIFTLMMHFGVDRNTAMSVFEYGFDELPDLSKTVFQVPDICTTSDTEVQV